jgi:hypothetical protein
VRELTPRQSSYYIHCVTPIERVTTFRIPDDLLEGMQAVKERDGMPFSEQLRRALRPWLEAKGVLSDTQHVKAAPRRVVKTRRRA